MIKEVLKEAKYFPTHAYNRMSTAKTGKIYPHDKYYFGEHAKQYLCWFEPEKEVQDQIILFYHGGGWSFGTPEAFSNRAGLLAEQGYQVVMPSHRKLPMHNYKQIREDLNLTLKKVYDLRKEKGGQGKKIILGGMSSGGNLAALIFFDPSILENTGFVQDDFAGAFLCAPPVKLEGMTESFILTGYAGRREKEMFKKASPINHLPEKFTKPLLIIHGTEDGLVSYQSTADFVEELQKVSEKNVTFHTIEKGSHFEAVSWAYTDNKIRKQILDWLAQVS